MVLFKCRRLLFKPKRIDDITKGVYYELKR